MASTSTAAMSGQGQAEMRLRKGMVHGAGGVQAGAWWSRWSWRGEREAGRQGDAGDGGERARRVLDAVIVATGAGEGDTASIGGAASRHRNGASAERVQLDGDCL